MKNKFVFSWLPLIFWVSGIFLVSSIPSHYFPFPPGVSRIPTEYLLHIIAFFVLFLLWYRLFQSNNKKAALKIILLFSFIFTMVVAFSKECWQLFIPTRSFSVKDILVDGGAATLAMLAVGIRISRRY
jgi:VanZ family protein